MSWSAVTAATGTWGSTTAASETWSRQTFTTRAWGMVSRQTEGSDGGVDFEYRFHETYPWLWAEGQPLRLTSTLSEGTP